MKKKITKKPVKKKRSKNTDLLKQLRIFTKAYAELSYSLINLQQKVHALEMAQTKIQGHWDFAKGEWVQPSKSTMTIDGKEIPITLT